MTGTPLSKSIAAGALTSAVDYVGLSSPPNMAIEDGAVMAAANFVGENYVAPLLQDVLPTSVVHVVGGIATGVVYAAANHFRQVSPFGGPVAQFFYAFGSNEVTNNLVCPMMGDIGNYTHELID